jgi:hypothetical protein
MLVLLYVLSKISIGVANEQKNPTLFTDVSNQIKARLINSLFRKCERLSLCTALLQFQGHTINYGVKPFK